MTGRSFILLISLFYAKLVTAASTPIVIHRNNITPLQFQLKLNVTTTRLPDLDRTRAKALIRTGIQLQSNVAHRRRGVISVGANNTAVSYTVEVGVGTPPTNYTLLIDTGSSNTWVGAGQQYIQTSSSHNTGELVSVTYGSGSFSGQEFTDTVTLGPSLVIKNQSIGSASFSQGFQGVDGILGIGPKELTLGTLSNFSETIPTITDNLFSQDSIISNLVAVSYEPISEAPVTNGELTFGATDSSKFIGDITKIPLTTTSPASEFWGIDQTVTYGDQNPAILAETSGIVDTGTTLILLATDAFQAYKNATGATLDEATGLLTITNNQLNNLGNLSFITGGQTFVLMPNAQLWPRSLNLNIGGQEGSIYLVVNDLGTESGTGLDFINGYTFLERFYSIFDTTNNELGLAITSDTFENIN